MHAHLRTFFARRRHNRQLQCCQFIALQSPRRSPLRIRIFFVCIIGVNSYYLMVAAADPLRRCEVDEILDSAKNLGISVIRLWAFSDGPTQWHSLQARLSIHGCQFGEFALFVCHHVRDCIAILSSRCYSIFLNVTHDVPSQKFVNRDGPASTTKTPGAVSITLLRQQAPEAFAFSFL